MLINVNTIMCTNTYMLIIAAIKVNNNYYYYANTSPSPTKWWIQEKIIIITILKLFQVYFTIELKYYDWYHFSVRVFLVAIFWAQRTLCKTLFCPSSFLLVHWNTLQIITLNPLSLNCNCHLLWGSGWWVALWVLGWTSWSDMDPANAHPFQIPLCKTVRCQLVFLAGSGAWMTGSFHNSRSSFVFPL